MQGRQIYLSFPMYNSDTLFEETVAACYKIKHGDGGVVRYHVRGSSDYNPEVITTCNELVFHTLDNSFSGKIDNLPSGVRKELKYAKDHGYKIWLAYKTMDGNVNLYDVNISDSIYSGIGGTSGNYAKHAIKVHVQVPTEKAVNRPSSFEKDVRRGAFFNL